MTWWLPINSVVVENAPTPSLKTTLEPPAIGSPLSRKLTVPRMPGDGVTMAVNMTEEPPVVARGVATNTVVVGAIDIGAAYMT